MRRKNVMVSFFITVLVLSACTNNFAKEAPIAADSSQNRVEAKSIFSNNVLRTVNRNKYIVCVENVSIDKSSDLTTDKLVNKVQQSLDKFKTDARWINAGYGSITVEVKAGCSFNPVLNNETAKHPIYSGKGDNFNRKVATPSSEALGIFIVDDKVIEQHFKDAPNRWSPEQLACEDNECNEVTKGIYLTSKEFKDLSRVKLDSEMVYGLGLESMIKPRAYEEAILKKEAERIERNK